MDFCAFRIIRSCKKQLNSPLNGENHDQGEVKSCPKFARAKCDRFLSVSVETLRSSFFLEPTASNTSSILTGKTKSESSSTNTKTVDFLWSPELLVLRFL